MGKYLKKFENHSQYENYMDGGGVALPNVSYCVTEGDVHYNPFSYANEYLTFVAKESGTFTFTPQNDNVISYSTDGGETWTEGNSVTVNNGDEVMWKGTMTPTLYNGIGKFSSTAEFNVQGNAMSLLYGDNYKGETDLTDKNSFYQLFANNKKVINAKNLSLPATTLTDGCYVAMFQYCTSLTTAPELPATTLADGCYVAMFRGCTSLTTAPELPATTLASYCYSGMFQGCTSLTTAPELLSTGLIIECYKDMFQGCTSLTTAPELPATTLAYNCYGSMFQGCTSLTTAPELSATTLVDYCYSSMFKGCTSLTTAPVLPATTLVGWCYQNMFNGCTSLNYIKAMFTTEPTWTRTQNWVSGVAATGTFVKNSAAQWDVSGVNGVPDGWTVQTASA